MNPLKSGKSFLGAISATFLIEDGFARGFVKQYPKMRKCKAGNFILFINISIVKYLLLERRNYVVVEEVGRYGRVNRTVVKV